MWNDLPDYDITTKGIDLKLWAKVMKYVSKYKSAIILVISALAVHAASEALTPLLTRFAIDKYINTGSKDGMWVLALAYAGIALFKGTAVFLFIYFAEKVGVFMSADLRKAAFRKLQELSFSYYDRTTAGHLIARMTSDVNRLMEVVSWGFVDIIWGIMMIVFLTTAMMLLSVKIALIVLIVVPGLALVCGYFQRKILDASRETRKNSSAITSSFNEGISGASTTKTLVREEKNLDEFTEKAGRLRGSSAKMQLLVALFLPMVLLLGVMGTSLALWQGGIMVMNELMTYGTLAAFISYTVSFFNPINDLASRFADFNIAQAAGERIFKLLETEPEIRDSAEVIEKYGVVKPSDKSPRLTGDILFDDVSFYYKENENVLENFTLDVKAGECVALVGETGSGKTTIVNLMCRFYEPTSGGIFIDGAEYRTFPLMHLQSNLGYMLQTPHLFSGTIRDNIRYGNLSASDEEVVEAAKLVKADDFIVKFEAGYDHVVSKGGGGLSTGQKQLICIARAIIADPSIFILDEATSSVDTETEMLIQDAIKSTIKGRTSFIIAHRLSTVRNADRILLIEKGRVAEQGSHAELMASEGKYYRLYTNQFDVV